MRSSSSRSASSRGSAPSGRLGAGHIAGRSPVVGASSPATVLHLAALALAVLAAALVVAGCDAKPQGPTVSPRSDVAVALPDKPSLAERAVPPRNPEGTWTVEGLLRSAGTEMGRVSKVKGIVVGVHKCPADSPGGECKPPPHLYLADAKDSPDRWQLLVTGHGSRVLGMAQEGLTLTLEGKLQMVSGDRNFIRQSGLLVLSADDPEPAPAE